MQKKSRYEVEASVEAMNSVIISSSMAKKLDISVNKETGALTFFSKSDMKPSNYVWKT